MSGKAIDLTGRVFGRLTVTGRNPTKPPVNGSPVWDTVCSCGNTKSVTGTGLRQGTTRSCGCLKRDEATQRAPLIALVAHGQTNAKELMICDGCGKPFWEYASKRPKPQKYHSRECCLKHQAIGKRDKSLG